MEFAGGSKKLKVKMGKELEERSKKWKEKKKFKEQKESIKKVRKVWCVMYSELFHPFHAVTSKMCSTASFK
jgi:hypothetical protein